MNERLEQLAIQAGIRLDFFGLGSCADGGNPDIGKFTEMIVQRTLDIVDSHTEIFQTDRDKAVIEHIKQSIKTDFGIK